MPDIRGDSPSALAFLRSWAQDGPWVLNAVDPDRLKGMITQTFDASSAQEALAFLEHWNGKRNLYFMVNVPREHMGKKAKKEHVGWVSAFHVDVDPDDPPAGKPTQEHYADERDKILEKFRAYPIQPSVILFSGGGYQGFWLLREPQEIDQELIEPWAKWEAYNRKLEKDLGGDHCWNIDRIMRVPGTVNLPDAKKRAKGREPRLAQVVQAHWDRLYEPSDFEPYVEVKKTTSKKSKDKENWVERVLCNGPDPDGAKSFGGDRSRALWAVCCGLVRMNWSVDDIVAALVDRSNKISDHIFDQNQPEKYARKQAEKAFEQAGGDFTFNERGQPHSTQVNIRVALGKLGVRMSYDEFSRRQMIEGPDELPRRTLGDREFNQIYLRIAEEFSFKPSVELGKMMIEDECYRNSYHPVRDYLDALRWDGKPRIDTWLIDHAGAEDTPFARAVCKLILMAAVRRVRQPGCKFDEIVVLESPQGFDKSSSLVALAGKPEWFTDSMPLDATDKLVIEQTSGKWLVEVAELKGMRRADVEHLKAMLSRQFDRSRLAWGRFLSEVPRQWVPFASTNSAAYLRDLANRRFWPLAVQRMDAIAVARNRDQLWAEAAAREAAGESIRLDPALYPSAEEEQRKRQVADPWEQIIESALNGYDAGKILAADVWNIVNVPVHMRVQEHNSRLGESMKSLGWERKKLRFGGKVSWCYVKGEAGKINITRDERGLLVEREGDMPEGDMPEGVPAPGMDEIPFE